jgi:hypothetical protein
MSMRATVTSRESPARRIGVVLSILFLASLGTVATMMGTPAGAHEQAGAPALPTAATR